MLHLMDKVPVKGIHHDPVAGELLKGQRRDKLCGIAGHDHFHGCPELHKGGCQRGSLIGGDATGHAQKYGFSLQHRYSPLNGSVFLLL